MKVETIIMKKRPYLDGPRSGPNSGNTTTSLIILLHGYGSDGNDLFSLVPLIAKYYPNSTFIAPNAPYSCKMSINGFEWFGGFPPSPPGGQLRYEAYANKNA